DDERVVVELAQEPAAHEAAALPRVFEDLQCAEAARQLVGCAGPGRKPQDGDDAHVLRRRAQASRETAAARISPLITYCSSGVVPSRLKPLPIICRKK